SWARYLPGKVGYCLDIDQNTQLRFDEDVIPLSPPWSFSIWLNRNTDTVDRVVLMTDSDTNVRLEDDEGDGKVSVRVAGVSHTFNYTMPIRVWKNLVFTCNGSEVSLYVDSVWNSKVNISMDLPCDSIIRGHGSGRMDGAFDELYIWQRVITRSEISELYNVGENL
ncbi:LamG-like jellyroll fold domain-containing protein, partial [Planctomycetota bacterium]